MVCKNCGLESSDVAFCPNCGTTLEEPFANNEAIVATDPGKGKGIASLILGIASLVLILVSCCCCGWLSILALVCAIVGLVLGRSAKRASEEAGFTNTMAKVGTILSIIALVLAILSFVFAIISAVFSMGSGLLSGLMTGEAFSDYGSSYGDYYDYGYYY